MKKFFVVLILFTGLSAQLQAQKFAYVDTKYILEKIPAYQDAQKQLDDLSAQWQKEIEEKFKAVDALYKVYLKERIVLTEEDKRLREQEIEVKEKEAKDLQRAKFGVGGELYTKRQDLVKPIQDDVYGAIKQLATEGNYAVIFDKSNNSNILYSNERYDKSDDVLEKMGISPK